METRARYILVGAFTLASAVALLGFLLWLGRVEINRTYAQYDIVFDTVSGLSKNSLVRYNGVDVGSVLSIALDAQNPSLVRVRIEINAATPVRKDTEATLSSQGVTGVSFVALAGGSRSSERLVAIPPAKVPQIASQPSVVQELTDAAPNLVNQAIGLIEDVRAFTTPENTAALAATLKSVESVTARVDRIAERVETIAASAETTLARVDAVLTEAEGTLSGASRITNKDIPDLVTRLQATLADVGATATELRNFARSDLPQYGVLATEARGAMVSIRALADRIGRDPSRFLLGDQTPDYRK
jgi:phospholipid/cholesterol/gamma-HCH transport system substrate-binding protein